MDLTKDGTSAHDVKERDAQLELITRENQKSLAEMEAIRPEHCAADTLIQHK